MASNSYGGLTWSAANSGYGAPEQAENYRRGARLPGASQPGAVAAVEAGPRDHQLKPRVPCVSCFGRSKYLNMRYPPQP